MDVNSIVKMLRMFGNPSYPVCGCIQRLFWKQQGTAANTVGRKKSNHLKRNSPIMSYKVDFSTLKLPFFCCLIGILIVVLYNPHITGQYNPLYPLNYQGPFFHHSIARFGDFLFATSSCLSLRFRAIATPSSNIWPRKRVGHGERGFVSRKQTRPTRKVISSTTTTLGNATRLHWNLQVAIFSQWFFLQEFG